MVDELLPDRIGVHVVKFLEHLRPAVDIEIVIPPLPEAPQQVFLLRKTQPELPLRSALSCSHAARKSLLEDLDDLRGRNRSGFTDEQVEMFWHDDIADQSEAVARADFLENLHRKIPGAGGGQEWPSLVATKGDEVVMKCRSPRPAMRLRFLGIGEKSGPPFAKTAQGRPPRKVLLSLYGTIYQWLLSLKGVEQKNQDQMSAPPARQRLWLQPN